MKIRLNGKITSLKKDIVTVADMISEMYNDRSGLVIEINGKIVPKNSFGNRRIDSGDVVEVIQFMGGG